MSTSSATSKKRPPQLPIGPAPDPSPPATSGDELAARLDTPEIRRRFWHMAPGFLPFILWGIDHNDPISFTLRMIILALLVVLGLLVFAYFRLIQRPGERVDRAGAVLGYAASVGIAFFVFPGQAEIGLAVLAILAFGDGSATLIGKLLRGPKLPWNPQKSWSGLIAFITVGSMMASVIYWGETYFNGESQGPAPTFAAALLCCGTAVFVCAIAESIPSRINDNVRVGAAAALSLAAAHAVVIGF